MKLGDKPDAGRLLLGAHGLTDAGGMRIERGRGK